MIASIAHGLTLFVLSHDLIQKVCNFWDHALSSRFSALVPLASIQIAIRRCGTLVVFSFRTHAGRAPNGRIEAIRHEQRGDSAAIKAIESS